MENQINTNLNRFGPVLRKNTIDKNAAAHFNSEMKPRDSVDSSGISGL